MDVIVSLVSIDCINKTGSEFFAYLPGSFVDLHILLLVFALLNVEVLLHLCYNLLFMLAGFKQFEYLIKSVFYFSVNILNS